MSSSGLKTIDQLFDYSEFVSLQNKSLNIKIKIFRKLTDYTELIKYIMTIMNEVKAYSDKNNINNFIEMFLDFEQTRIQNLDYNFFKMLFPFLEKTYPNIIKEIICINVSLMLKVVYKVFKGFLSKDARNKIVIRRKNDKGESITLTTEQIDNDIYGDDEF